MGVGMGTKEETQFDHTLQAVVITMGGRRLLSCVGTPRRDINVTSKFRVVVQRYEASAGLGTVL